MGKLPPQYCHQMLRNEPKNTPVLLSTQRGLFIDPYIHWPAAIFPSQGNMPGGSDALCGYQESGNEGTAEILEREDSVEAPQLVHREKIFDKPSSEEGHTDVLVGAERKRGLPTGLRPGCIRRYD